MQTAQYFTGIMTTANKSQLGLSSEVIMPTDTKPLLKSNKAHNYGATSPSTSEGAADPNSIAPLNDTGTSSQSTGNDDPLPLPIDPMKSTLSILQRIGFGLGHVFNDLCAGVWFSYTLLYMQGALQMPGSEAGALVMVGQVGDALATPIIGILVDKYGTKRKWHIAGKLSLILVKSREEFVKLSVHW